MLHSSQTVIRQTYFFDNVSNPNIKFHPELEDNAVINTACKEPSDTPEQDNFALAKNIANHKQSLVSLLANTPVCTLWLLTKLEQNCEIDNEEILATALPDSTSYLSTLRDFYYHLLDSLQAYSLNSFEVINARQNLVKQLQNFPFYTEQLKELTTFVFFAYYSKLQQTNNYIFNPEVQEAVLKKLHTLNKHTASNQLAELKQIQSLYSDNEMLEQFLLPADDDKHSFLTNLLHLEGSWLLARQQLANANHRLVLYLANQYKGGFLEFNDLVQEGQSGLLKAVDRFDYQKGFQFSTYAAYWIRQAISRSLIRNERVVRLPFGQMANISKLYRVKDALYLKHGFEPSTQDLAEQLQLPEAEINHLLFISQSPTSLDIPVGDEDNSMTKADFIEQQVYEPALTTIFKKELIDAINAAINTLSSKEAQIISCRFGINTSHEMTLEEIGRELNLTRERVRQIQVAAIKKLQQYFGAELNSFI